MAIRTTILSNDGIFYRTIIESGLANSAPLTGITIQSSLPLILRGSAAAMTNLTDPTRYDLLGIPNSTNGNLKAFSYLNAANGVPLPDKKNREMLELQYENMSKTLNLFAGINFTGRRKYVSGLCQNRWRQRLGSSHWNRWRLFQRLFPFPHDQ